MGTRIRHFQKKVFPTWHGIIRFALELRNLIVMSSQQSFNVDVGRGAVKFGGFRELVTLIPGLIGVFIPGRNWLDVWSIPNGSAPNLMYAPR